MKIKIKIYAGVSEISSKSPSVYKTLETISISFCTSLFMYYRKYITVSILELRRDRGREETVARKTRVSLLGLEASSLRVPRESEERHEVRTIFPRTRARERTREIQKRQTAAVARGKGALEDDALVATSVSEKKRSVEGTY